MASILKNMTVTPTENTFSQASDAYQQARPRYPDALYDWMLQHVPARQQAWDCATGNGQAAADLARYFSMVQATDISAEQVSHGLQRNNIMYSAQPAEQTGFAAASFDLISVAQALHWFDYSRFWTEVKRVARPDALFCGWGYGWFNCDAELQQVFVQPFRAVLAPYWAANNQILWNGYPDADVAFPFERIAAPEFTIEVNWTIEQLLAYLQTWSACKRALQDSTAAQTLNRLISGAQDKFSHYAAMPIQMPLSVIAGRIR